MENSDGKKLMTCVIPEARVPVILHLPHSGTDIPPGIRKQLHPSKRGALDDADWFLDTLYDFCPEIGVSVLKANYHRWVVDLNRDPDGNSLYNDGRVITGVVPLTDFNGEKLYIRNPTGEEIKDRIETFHSSYFAELHEIIDSYLDEFGKVIIWDGHSIRRKVPGIQPEPFPDLILGTDDNKSLKAEWQDVVRSCLGSGLFQLSENHPFKGGHITRSLYNHSRGVYTLQLEMSKDLYMKNSETEYDEIRAGKVKNLFKSTFEQLIKSICQD